MLVGADELCTRYFRIKLQFTPNDSALEDVTEPISTNFYEMPGAISITPNSPPIRFPSVKRCIYCGSPHYDASGTRPLGEEHIISEGMGGTLTLPEASCRECESRTSTAETSVLGHSFFAVRHKLKLRMKRGKIRRTLFPFTAVVNGKDVKFTLPLDTHPTMVFLVSLHAPGILVRRPIGAPGIRGMWMHGLNDFAKAKSSQIVSPSLDTVKFCQFLAKSAHSFAFATLGDSSIEYLLPEFIRRRFARAEQYLDCYHWVGGDVDQAPSSSSLHEIGLAFAEIEKVWFLTTHIRLFANLGAPVYVVATGILKAGLTPGQALARAAIPTIVPEHMTDKIPAARS